MGCLKGTSLLPQVAWERAIQKGAADLLKWKYAPRESTGGPGSRDSPHLNNRVFLVYPCCAPARGPDWSRIGPLRVRKG